MQEVQKCVFIMNLKLALFLEDDTKNSEGWPQNNIQDGKNARCQRHSSYAVHVLKKHKHIVMMYLKWKIMISP